MNTCFLSLIIQSPAVNFSIITGNAEKRTSSSACYPGEEMQNGAAEKPVAPFPFRSRLPGPVPCGTDTLREAATCRNATPPRCGGAAPRKWHVSSARASPPKVW